MIGRDERLLLMLAALVALLFLAFNLHYAGQLVLPLDDAYIHAQYARSIADGNAFRFTPGAETSAGATGLLYPLLLAPLYKLGLRGDGLPAAMFVLNAVLFAISSLLVYRVTLHAGRRDVALLAGVLFVLSGPLAWGYLSGMELGLFCVLWLAVAWALLLDSPVLVAIWATALAWVRPEGWLWCWALALGAPWLAGRGSRFASRPLWRWLPVAVGAVPLAVNLLLGGSVSPASAQPKSPLHLPELHLPTILQHGVGFLATVIKRLLTGVGGPDVAGPLNRPDAWTHAAPLTLLLILLAVAAARRAGVGSEGGRRPTPAGGPMLWIIWLGIVLSWVAFTTGSSTHHFRHLLTAWPAVVLLTAEGVGVLTALAAKHGARLAVRSVVGGYLLVFGALGTLSFALLYGQEAHAFSRQYLDTARWIDDHLPADARIASLDAGLLGYYGNREFFDLFGLATPVMREVTVFFAGDEGTKCEVMERLPAVERPSHFVLHERRFDHEEWNPYSALAARGPDGRPRVVHESRVLIDVPRVGDNLQVWEADWSLANSGDRPASGARVLDRVDIGDPVSEDAHGVRMSSSEPGFFGRNRYDLLPARDGSMVADGGRGLAGRLDLRLASLVPGRSVELRLRTLATANDTPLAISIDGQPLGEWQLPPSGAGWREASIGIPGSAIRHPEMTLTLDGVVLLYHVWVLAAPAGEAPAPS